MDLFKFLKSLTYLFSGSFFLIKKVMVRFSVVDPNTLNLDPDPGFWPNLDSDPGLFNKF